MNGPGVYIEEALLEVLRDNDLLAFQGKLCVDLHLRKIEHFDHVKDKDLLAAGIPPPAIRRLKYAVAEKKKKMGKKSIFGSRKRESSAMQRIPIENNENSEPIESDSVILKEQIKLMERLGEGTFAVVKRALWMRPNGQKVDVAVKILRDVSPLVMEDLQMEAANLRRLQHPNLIRLYGVVEEPAMMVFELCQGGSLIDRLRDNSKPTLLVSSLLDFCQQIAKGMTYLEAKHCVHRDLAARNILLSADETIVKICDFGLMRCLEENERLYVMNPQKKVPFAWCPPEALRHRQFSHASDVWSMGVAMWEIFTYGQEPWCGCTGLQVLQKVEAGERLEKPRKSSTQIYDLMLLCWKLNPDHRPKFNLLRGFLKQAELSLCEVRESNAGGDGESLELAVNDRVIVIENSSILWFGQSTRTRLFGFFPRSVVFVPSERVRQESVKPKNSRISLPIKGSFIHAGHGDISGGGWGKPDIIDDIYLRNPVLGQPIDRFNGATLVDSMTNLNNSTSRPNVPPKPSLAMSVDPIDKFEHDFDRAQAEDFSPTGLMTALHPYDEPPPVISHPPLPGPSTTYLQSPSFASSFASSPSTFQSPSFSSSVAPPPSSSTATPFSMATPPYGSPPYGSSPSTSYSVPPPLSQSSSRTNVSSVPRPQGKQLERSSPAAPPPIKASAYIRTPKEPLANLNATQPLHVNPPTLKSTPQKSPGPLLDELNARLQVISDGGMRQNSYWTMPANSQVVRFRDQPMETAVLADSNTSTMHAHFLRDDPFVIPDSIKRMSRNFSPVQNTQVTQNVHSFQGLPNMQHLTMNQKASSTSPILQPIPASSSTLLPTTCLQPTPLRESPSSFNPMPPPMSSATPSYRPLHQNNSSQMKDQMFTPMGNVTRGAASQTGQPHAMALTNGRMQSSSPLAQQLASGPMAPQSNGRMQSSSPLSLPQLAPSAMPSMANGRLQTTSPSLLPQPLVPSSYTTTNRHPSSSPLYPQITSNSNPVTQNARLHSSSPSLVPQPVTSSSSGTSRAFPVTSSASSSTVRFRDPPMETAVLADSRVLTPSFASSTLPTHHSTHHPPSSPQATRPVSTMSPLMPTRGAPQASAPRAVSMAPQATSTPIARQDPHKSSPSPATLPAGSRVPPASVRQSEIISQINSLLPAPSALFYGSGGSPSDAVVSSTSTITPSMATTTIGQRNNVQAVSRTPQLSAPTSASPMAATPQNNPRPMLLHSGVLSPIRVNPTPRPTGQVPLFALSPSSFSHPISSPLPSSFIHSDDVLMMFDPLSSFSSSSSSSSSRPYDISKADQMEMLYKDASFTSKAKCDRMVGRCNGDVEVALKELKLEHLRETGIARERAQAETALAKHGWDLNGAANAIITGTI